MLLVFILHNRVEYVTGFQKRKQIRRKNAEKSKKEKEIKTRKKEKRENRQELLMQSQGERQDGDEDKDKQLSADQVQYTNCCHHYWYRTLRKLKKKIDKKFIMFF